MMARCEIFGHNGAAMIARERYRQMDEEGWSQNHDDLHNDESLAWAAVCYAAPDSCYRMKLDKSTALVEPVHVWPES